MNSNPRHRLLRASGLILLILVLLLIFWPTDSARLESDSSSEENLREQGVGIKNTQLGSSGKTRIIRTRSKTEPQDGEIDPYRDWELSKILAHFMVPPGEFRAGSTYDSIRKLNSIYHEHSGHYLNFEVSPLQSDAISFQHGNISLRTLLAMVAGLSGNSLEITSNKIIFKEISPPRQQTEIEQSSPFALSKDEFEETLEYLKSQGFSSPEVYGFPDDRTNLANLIRSLQDARLDPDYTATQVRLLNKIITFPPGFEFEPTTLNREEFEKVILDWAQTKGVDMMTMPSVVANPGQNATIEIGKEVIIPDLEDQDNFVSQFVGIQINSNPVIAGLDQFQIKGNISISSADPQTSGIIDPDSIEVQNTDSEIHLQDGSHVLIPIKGENNVPTIQIITPERIDLAGRRFLPPKGRGVPSEKE